METIVAIDVGTKRVGVAKATISGAVVSENHQITPLDVFDRAQDRALEAILKLASESSCKKIVIGMPCDVHGGKTAQCADVEKFSARLKKRFAGTLIFVDEHLSSEEAKNRFQTDKRFTKEKLDAFAAAVILEDALKLGLCNTSD